MRANCDGFTNDVAVWIIKAAKLQQIVIAQRRIVAHFERRAVKAEADATYYAREYEDVLRMCARANFNPYHPENAEGER